MLTDRQLQRAKPQAQARRLADGRGLALVVEPNGRRWWRFDYRYAGKRKTMSFGPYPEVGLAKARELRRDARHLVREGRDPSVERQRARRQQVQAGALTFEVLAREWLERQRGVYAPATYDRVTHALATHAYPAIGPRPIGTLEPPDILAMLQRIERRGRRETAHRVKQCTGQIFRYAIVTGRAERDPTADLRGALLPVKVTHYAAITEPESVGALLRAIEGFTGSEVVGTALRLAPLVFVRPGNLRAMEWRELDLDGDRLWRIPAAKMKMRLDHVVPLARQAVDILRPMRELTGRSRYVFPSARTRERPMSDMALNGALRRLGFEKDEMTAHGFRAMARTLLDERLRIPPEVIEVQLAHRAPGPLGAAYNRTQYLEQRIAMMQAWADYLDELREAR